MLALTVIVLLGVASAAQGKGFTEDKLATMLLMDYNKGVFAGTTDLKLNLKLLCAEVNKLDFHLTTKVLEILTWTDKRLKWNPSEFNNIDKIRLPAKMIFTPDVKIFNSHRDEELRDDVNVIIHSDGKVMWVPITTYKTNCIPGGKGTFNCKLMIGSWTYDDTKIRLTMEHNGLDMSGYLDTCRQEVTDIRTMVQDHQYKCCPNENYPRMVVEFTVHDRI